jgi:hypothetical protein
MRALTMDEVGFVSGGGTPLAQQKEQAAYDAMLKGGLVPYGTDGKFMVDSEGEIFMTPRYAGQVRDTRIDWLGVLRDLGNIGIGVATWEITAAWFGGEAFVAWLVSTSLNYATTGHGH